MGTAMLSCPGVRTNRMVTWTFGACLPPAPDTPPPPDSPTLGALPEVPDYDDDELESLDVLGILLDFFQLGEKRRLLWRS